MEIGPICPVRPIGALSHIDPIAVHQTRQSEI